MQNFDPGHEYLILGDVKAKLGLASEAHGAWCRAEEFGSQEAESRLARLTAPATSHSSANKQTAAKSDVEVEDVGEQHDRLLQLVAAGDLVAANELGTLLAKEGLFEDAIDFHAKAAEAGLPDAQNNLGADYRWLGDLDKAIYWYTKAAEAGYPIAQNNLAIVYLARSQPHLALPWLELASAAGNTDATLNMANVLAAEGFPGDALNLLRPLANNDLIQACNPVALLLARLGKTSDSKEYWLKGASAGDPNCLLNLGVFYRENGDEVLALEWLLLAERFGHPEATKVLGTLSGESSDWLEHALDLYEASLVAESLGNLEEADALLRQAATNGWNEAQYDLGAKLMESWSSNEDSDPALRDEAMNWFVQAARTGNADARDALMEYLSPEGFARLNL